MIIEQKVKELEKEVDELRHDINVIWDDKKNILKYLRKKYPQDFLPGGQFRPEVI